MRSCRGDQGKVRQYDQSDGICLAGCQRDGLGDKAGQKNGIVCTVGQSDGESDGESTGGGGAGAQCEHSLPGQDGAPPHPHGPHLLHALPPPGHPPPHVSINHPPSSTLPCSQQEVQSITHNWMLASLPLPQHSLCLAMFAAITTTTDTTQKEFHG